jgi:hypothetical protein
MRAVVVIAHTPHRPTWDCEQCGAAWPCAPAKVLLSEEFAADRLALLLYLAAFLWDAINDSVGGNPEPAFLFDRFLGWARASTKSCRPAVVDAHTELVRRAT